MNKRFTIPYFPITAKKTLVIACSIVYMNLGKAQQAHLSLKDMVNKVEPNLPQLHALKENINASQYNIDLKKTLLSPTSILDTRPSTQLLIISRA